MNATLLVELLTEELPPKSVMRLAEHFAYSLTDELKKMQFVAATGQPTIFATPRRLALMLPQVSVKQAVQTQIRKGPTLLAGLKNGEPTAALLGFARSCGVEWTELIQLTDRQPHLFAYESAQLGQLLADVLPTLIEHSIKKLPVAKWMRWGEQEHQFVRPVHGVVLLHGTELITGEVLGLESSRQTWGHRFLSAEPIILPDAECYPRLLFERGRVMASFSARRELIVQRLTEAAQRWGGYLACDEALLDEVTALVEWPVVLAATFDPAFLVVPQACLILAMQNHQKYFPVLDAAGKLLPHFLLVSNLESVNPEIVVQGNERVLRARLSDACFFYETDKKERLDARLVRLKEVAYHEKIGSQWERVARLECLSGLIAERLGADCALTRRAAVLAKADLLTQMVGEFPELQGIMGQHYALLQGEHPIVAAAIEEHYRPRFAGDSLPVGKEGQALALADKLETLVGIWGVGLLPTGEKDPFALRRAALGIVRILLGLKVDLRELLTLCAHTFPPALLSDDVVEEVLRFCQERLKHFLSGDHAADAIDAVLALSPSCLDSVPPLLHAVATFKTLPQASALAAANKRIKNLLKKNDAEFGQVNPTFFEHSAEHALFQAIETLKPVVEPLFIAGEFSAALTQLASLKAPLDTFFDGVLVMDENLAIRANRLALLAHLARLFNRCADLSLLDI